MYTGGTHNTPQAAHVLRYAGLIIPIILVAFGYLYASGIIKGVLHTDIDMLTVISVAWIALGLWQFFLSDKHEFIAALHLVLYHILAAAYLLFVTGIATPLVACWIILMIASYLYFNRRGMLLSIVAFTVTVGIDLFLTGTSNLELISYDLAVLVAILLSGLVIMSITKVQSIDRLELKRSHDQEILQRDRILTIVNNLADAVLSTDEKGIVRVYNAACLNLLDTNESLNGHHIDTALTLVDQDSQAVSMSDLMKHANSTMIRDDVWYKFEDGEQIRLEVTISPIRKSFQRTSSGHDGYIIIMRDVTKTKGLEEERDEFISVVSHELRTPVTVVEAALSNIELMIKNPDIKEERVLESVQLAHDQTLYLAKMVNDLSTLSRAERGVSDEREEINVKDLIATLYDTYEPEARDKGLALNLDLGARLSPVEASRLYLEELLQNFITNAIKYTKKGSITISVHEKNRQLSFAVKDTGIGISKSEQAKVFEKFYRSEDYRTRESGGTGLGLYVVTKLARKLDTEVTLTSRLNHGSTFGLTLPAHKAKKK